MSMDQIQEYRCPLSPVGESPVAPAYSASKCQVWVQEGLKPGEKTSLISLFLVSRHRTHAGGRALAVVPPSPVMRHSSDPQLSPPGPDNPPVHPAHASHQSQSSESAGNYCDLRPCPAGPPKPPTKSYVERLRVEEGRREGGRQDGEGWFSAPQVETASSFRPSRYKKTEAGEAAVGLRA